ncbi:LytTR family DNA-binding domain-containing protein [Mesorhizobium xinjiangense]|uniref:LytTR family DNA-binding domain-containing protein n=1 Tax=Mesorhizobium xinjiangense TaxID=2678685 RepID=UPI0012EE2E8C|nr:LytTR family DNA-binding domain-containing protein [Mesorhizobium xinjiangense]
MTDGPLQFTKRELQRLFFSPRFWACLAGAAVLLGLAGPFGTYEALALPARLAYWAAIAAATYFTGVACVFFLARTMSPRAFPRHLHFVAAGALAGIPVAVVVTAVNAAVFPARDDVLAFVPLVFYTMAIAAVVSALVPSLAGAHVAAAQQGVATGSVGGEREQPRPRIVDRMPADARGELSHMTVEDHYVNVRTTRGGGLVLMRLGDAIAETQGVEGMRIHRSHWVAKNAVRDLVRSKGRLFVRLKDGTMLPVSRTYRSEVRSAGFG